VISTSTAQDEKKCLHSPSSKTHVVVTPANLQKEAKVQHLLLDLLLSTYKKKVCKSREEV